MDREARDSGDGVGENAVDGDASDALRGRRVSDLLANVPGMVYRCRNERGWPMAFVSEACAELTGYDPAALEGDEVSWGADLIAEGERESVWETVQREIDEEGTFSVTYRIETADGESRWVRDDGRGIFEDGALVGIEGVIVDITERKRLESELDEVFGRVSDAFFALDEEWRFTYLNERAHELINPEGRRLEGKDVWAEFPDALSRSFKDQYERAMYEQETVAFEEYYPDPLDSWFEIRAYPSETGLSVYFRDVTERKEREQELELFRNLLDRSSDAVLVSDPETGRILDVNDTAARRLDYDRENLLELTIPDIETEMTSQADWHSFIEDLRAEGQTTFRGSHERQDGSTFPVEVNVSYVELNREYVLSMARDVTERKEYERELQRKERRYEAVFEDPNILVGLLDPDGTVLDINRTAMEYVDADLDAVTGEPFWETPWWGDSGGAGDEVREWVERAANGEYVDFEADLARPDGEQYAIEGYFRPVTNDEGEVVSIIVSDRDVTERKRRERALEESERRYRALAEHFPNGIVTLFDHDYEYTLAAGRGFETISADPADLEGRTFDEAWGGDTAETLRPAFEGALDGEERSVELDYEGREWIVHAAPVTDEDGEVFAGMTMAQDITERRAYERRLEESEQRYRALAENFPNGGVGVFDEDLRYTLVTGTMWDDIPPDAADLEGETIWETLPADTAEDVAPIFRGALDGETDSVVSELGGRTYRVWATPLRDASGEITAGQSIAVDITEQLQREEELKESNERLEQFAYAASHDLQEPLRMVSSYLSLIERRYEDDLPEDALEFFEYAVDGAERMREMIDALLEYSRVETEGRPFESVDLDAVVEDARQDLEVRIEESDAEISVGSLPAVEGDEDQLRQVFQNLLDNGIKYAGDERPRIDIDAERDGDEWVIAVRDEGIGIDADHTERVFEVFQRLHTQDEHSGTGIGLALCRRIIERHGGDIWAESNDEEGTTFYCTLPVTEGE